MDPQEAHRTPKPKKLTVFHSLKWQKSKAAKFHESRLLITTPKPYYTSAFYFITKMRTTRTNLSTSPPTRRRDVPLKNIGAIDAQEARLDSRGQGINDRYKSKSKSKSRHIVTACHSSLRHSSLQLVCQRSLNWLEMHGPIYFLVDWLRSGVGNME